MLRKPCQEKAARVCNFLRGDSNRRSAKSSLAAGVRLVELVVQYDEACYPPAAPADRHEGALGVTTTHELYEPASCVAMHSKAPMGPLAAESVECVGPWAKVQGLAHACFLPPLPATLKPASFW